jgi:hypothetical protein
MKEGTQAARLLTWLRQNPGSTGMDIVVALRIPKYTSRISDLRAAGYIVECWADDKGIDRYTVRDRPPVTTGVQEGLAL